MNRLVNTTVLSNFAAVGRLQLLHAVTGLLYLPTEVYNEILAGQLAGYAFYDRFERHVFPVTTEGWLHLVSMTANELQLSLSLPTSLHGGEAACLAIARVRGWGFLTDDRSARRRAREWSIPLSGTTGLLLQSVVNGHLSLDEGNALLRQMMTEAHYRPPTTDLALLLPQGH